jgi:hypothetical protein
MRWGNYDTVNDASRFVSGEVPSGLSDYPNSVPGNNNLPASFYKAGQPSWWVTPFGTPAWPAIGPDVSGGSISGVGGHVYKIPARLCYENLSHNGGNPNLITNFNADNCYGSGGTPDTEAPVTTITTNGGANFSTSSTSVTLDGGATDNIQVEFNCRYTNALTGVNDTAAGAFTWTASVALSVGANPITVYCHDAANNEGPATITVTRNAIVSTFHPRIRKD